MTSEFSLRRWLVAAAVLAAAALVPSVRSTSAAESAPKPAEIPVSAALDSCARTGSEPICEIEVSFAEVPGATSYEATITAPDGSVLLSAVAKPGAGAYSVPYRGDGTYGVRIVAFGSSDG